MRGKLFRAAAAAGLTLLASPALAADACPALRWTTLGTAGGPVPTPERMEPANLLTAGDQLVLVDTGDGTVGQLAKAGLDLRTVRSVFISHHHMDHTGGLAAVIGLRWMNTMPGVLTVYGPPGTAEYVDGVIKTMQPQSRVGFGLGVATQRPADSVKVVELQSGSVVKLGDLTVTAAGNSHFDAPAAASGPAPLSLSYRFQVGGRSITYTGDTGPSDAVTKLAQGTDMLVSEVIDLDPILTSIKARRPDMDAETYGNMQRHLATHHITPLDLGKLAQAASVKRLVLTHFAIPPGPLTNSEGRLRGGISQTYRGPTELAQDLASFDVGCD